MIIEFEQKFPEVFEAWYHSFTISCIKSPSMNDIIQIMKIIDNIEVYKNESLKQMYSCSDIDDINEYGGIEDMGRIHFGENLDNFSLWFPYKSWPNGYTSAHYKNKKLKETNTDHD